MSKEQLIKELETIPEFAIEEVYHFLLFLKERINKKHIISEVSEPELENRSNSILNMVDEITRDIPREEWKKLPKDFAKNLDFYLYGAPKVEE